MPVGNRPIFLEQPCLLFFREKPIAVFLVKSNSPFCIGPGSDENGSVGFGFKYPKQLRSDPLISMARPDVGVPDKGHLSPILNPHHPDQAALIFESPEGDS